MNTRKAREEGNGNMLPATEKPHSYSSSSLQKDAMAAHRGNCFCAIKQFLFGSGSFTLFQWDRPPDKLTAFEIELSKRLSIVRGDNDIMILITGRVEKEEKYAFISDASDRSKGALRPKQNVNSFDTDSLFGISAFEYPDDPSRSVFFVHLASIKHQKIHEALDSVLLGLSSVRGDKSSLKLSGLIHLEGISTSPPTKPSSVDFTRLRQRIEGQNITVVTTGWDDDKSKESKQQMRNRQSQLLQHWKSLVDCDVNVVRLSAPGKKSQDVSHNSWNIVELVLAKPREQDAAMKRRKAEDEFFADAQTTDLVIPVMGPTGAGKSTFVNYVVGDSVASVGHNLKSETSSLQPIILPHSTDPTRRIILVDTPGFDDSELTDEEILQRITAWLTRSYSEKIPLAGIIYLHDISQTRVPGTVKKNLEVFSKMIGRNATQNVVLVTTKWELVEGNIGLKREEQLKADHWKEMASDGARFHSFKDSHESAGEIVRFVTEPTQDETPTTTRGVVTHLEIQVEMVDKKKKLPQTEAAKALVLSLEEEIERRRQKSKEATGTEKEKIDEEIAKIDKQIHNLSYPSLFAKLWSTVTSKFRDALS